jgi:hypothetical protein
MCPFLHALSVYRSVAQTINFSNFAPQMSQWIGRRTRFNDATHADDRILVD